MSLLDEMRHHHHCIFGNDRWELSNRAKSRNQSINDDNNRHGCALNDPSVPRHQDKLDKQ